MNGMMLFTDIAGERVAIDPEKVLSVRKVTQAHPYEASDIENIVEILLPDHVTYQVQLKTLAEGACPVEAFASSMQDQIARLVANRELILTEARVRKHLELQKQMAGNGIVVPRGVN